MALLVCYGLARVDETELPGATAARVLAGAADAPWTGSLADARRWPGVRVSDVIGPGDVGGSTAGAADLAGRIRLAGAHDVAGDSVGAGEIDPVEAASRDPRLPPRIPVVRAPAVEAPRPPIRLAPAPTPTTTTARPRATTTTTAKPRPTTTTTSTTTTVPPNREEGWASWYEAGTPGNCAHRTIAKGTVVTVTNTENGHRVTCRVNDRGPYIDGRVIDLSRSDFEALAPSGRGVVPVRLEWR